MTRFAARRFQLGLVVSTTVVVVFSAKCFIVPLHAQTTWTGLAGTGDWTAGGNWSAGTPAAGVTARFVDAGNAQNAITLGAASRSLGSLLFDTAAVAPYTFTSGTMNFDAGGAITVGTDVAQLQTISTPITTSGAFSIIENSPLATGSGALHIGGGITLTAANSVVVNVSDPTGRMTIAGGITGSAGVTKNGPGQLAYASAANSYSGPTTINGGLLEFSNTDRLGNGSATNTITINNGATLRKTGNSTVTINPGVTIGSGGGTIDINNTGSNATVIINGPLTGTGTTLTKNGMKLMTLAGANTGFTNSQVIVNGGASAALTGTTATGLKISHSDALGSTNVVRLNPGTTGGSVGNNVSLQNNISIPSSVSLVMNTTSVLDGSNTIRVALASETGLNNTWNGPISIQGDGTAQFYSTVAGSTFTINGSVTAANDFPGQLTLRGNSATATGVLNGVLSLGNALLLKTDSATWTINSTGNTWSNTAIETGTLKIGVNNALPTSATLTMGTDNNTHILDLNGNNQTVANITIGGAGTRTITNSSGTASILTVNNSADGFYNDTDPTKSKITGNLSVVKSGSATLSLNGNNTYSGTTTVASGRLNIGGSHTGGGQYTVQTGGTLAGTASIGSPVQVDAGGNLAPGNGIGVFAVGSANIDGKLLVEYDGDLSTIDLLNVTGAFDITGATVDFDNLGASTLTSAPHVFVSYGAGLLTGTFTPVDLPAGYSINYNYLGLNQIALVAGGSLPGDYNGDGKVNAADYVLWRKDPASHGNDPGGYIMWRQNFGSPPGSGASLPLSSPIPEPSSIAVVWGVGAVPFLARRRAQIFGIRIVG